MMASDSTAIQTDLMGLMNGVWGFARERKEKAEADILRILDVESLFRPPRYLNSVDQSRSRISRDRDGRDPL